MKPRLLFCVLVSLGASVYAGPRSYQCEVLEVVRLDHSTGKQRVRANDALLGHRFAVDRTTGILVSDYLLIWGEDKPLVLARGSEENSFRVVWSARAGGKDGVHFATLKVEEFEKGDNKPFVYHSDSPTLAAGICK